MSAYDIWLDPPDEPDELIDADIDVDYEPEPVGDYRSDERQIMLEQRYDQ
ncbi:hypothetical protein [Pseudomonas sp. NC02]|nr:hypothetical protein [Pseudomonas sp. NC02]